MAQYEYKPQRFLFVVLILITIPSACFAELWGQVRYSFETNYLDSTLSQQVFTQDYLANIRGAVIEDRIGSYGLGFQYQKGTAELKNLTFTNSLNFRDVLKLATSYSRKDYTNLLYDNNPISDNRLSFSASYYIPNLPTITGGYETGNAKAASAEGINKNDKKSEVGLSYSLFGNTISARYVDSILYDDTYLSTGANLLNRDNLLTFNGSGGLGDRISYSGSYSDQSIFNQVGIVSEYNQRLQNISATSSIKLTQSISLNPEFINTVNLVDYNVPIGQKNYQRSRKIGASLNIQPVNFLEFILDYGTGFVNMVDSDSDRTQGLLSRRAALNFNYSTRFYLNADIRDETYSGVSASGRALYLNGYLTYLLDDGIKLTYKRMLNRFNGEVFTLASGSGKNQDLNDWILGVNMPNNIYIEGNVSLSSTNSYNYRTVSGAISYSPTPQNVIELRREDKFGNEVTQTVDYQTDSFKINVLGGGISLVEQIYLVSSKTITDTAVINQYGIRNLTEVNYALGDSAIKCSVNSERRDQNSSAFTRMYLSFERNF